MNIKGEVHRVDFTVRVGVKLYHVTGGHMCMEDN